jgi:lysophospholipase L1-like esterase
MARAVALVALSALAACGSGTEPGSTSGTGGATSTGGARQTGGATGSGGESPTGGAGGATSPGTGGAPATGGAGGTGGGPAGAAGGAAGSSAAGGHAGGGQIGGAGHAGGGQAGGGHAGAGAGGAGGTGGSVAMTCSTGGAATSKTPTIWVVGDSTASVYTSDLYPRMGWAQPLQEYYAPACATVQDKALSGRSSKSFYDEGDWTPIKNALRAGDAVIIQFGHNDEKSDDPTRYTDPFTTYEQYLTDYIDDTRAKGATPILATSINRNSWSNGVLQDTHGNYPVAVRQLAAAKQVALVDATALTKAYFTKIGQTATTALFMDLAPGQFPNYPNGNTDDTHLQDKGAHLVAQMILADMYRQAFPIAFLLKAVPQAP